MLTCPALDQRNQSYRVGPTPALLVSGRSLSGVGRLVGPTGGRSGGKGMEGTSAGPSSTSMSGALQLECRPTLAVRVEGRFTTDDRRDTNRQVRLRAGTEASCHSTLQRAPQSTYLEQYCPFPPGGSVQTYRYPLSQQYVGIV